MKFRYKYVMDYTISDLAFILYNNRSVNGVVKNFLPKLNPLILSRLEIDLSKIKSEWDVDEKMVEVNINEFNLDVEDVFVTKEQLSKLTDIFLGNIGKFSDSEKTYLSNRGITDEIITKNKIFGLSNIKDINHLQIIGATCHPTLSNFLDDGIEWGGIIIPLFDQSGILSNCAIRKINSHKSLKYSLACPDIPVWGLEDIEDYSEEISLCEGLFDSMALRELGKKSVSCSSAMWSGMQLYQIVVKKPRKITIYSDKDKVGLRTSGILRDFFNKYNIEVEILVSKFTKDPAEHYFELSLGLNDFESVNVDKSITETLNDDSFNFIEYLKNRYY
jgi:hypothetical protein